MAKSDIQAMRDWVVGATGWGTAMKGAMETLLGWDPAEQNLSSFGGFASLEQGGFGFSIDTVDGNPDGARELLGAAESNHSHRGISWQPVQTSGMTLLPEHAGTAILFNPSGPITVILPDQATQAFSPGEVITLLNYTSNVVTIAPATGVNVDGVNTTFNLVQHAFLTLTRLPANNFWNRSGTVA